MTTTNKTYTTWPCAATDNQCIDKQLKIALNRNISENQSPAAFRSSSLPESSSNCFNIGDIGPGGGIVFATPNSSYTLNNPLSSSPTQTVNNNTNYYYEVTQNELAEYTMSNQNYSSIMLTTACCGNELGYEFGNSTSTNLPLPGILGWNVGDGQLNTTLLSSLPSGGSTSPPNPTCDTHGLAANLVNQHVAVSAGTTYSDWFLPSFGEFQLLAANLSFLPTSNNYTSNFYHTSSDFGVGIPEEFAVAYDVVGGYPLVSKKCHTLGVLAIRKFECPTSIYPDCFDHSNVLNDGWTVGDDYYGDPKCMEYNYKHGTCGYYAGSFCIHSGTVDNVNTSNFHWSYNLPLPQSIISNITTPYSSLGHNILPYPSGTGMIGSPYALLFLSSVEAKGRSIPLSDFTLNSQATITLWDKDKLFLGKWSAIICDKNQPMVMGVDTGAFGIAGQDPILEIVFKNITHIEGNYPVLDFTHSQLTQKSWAYMKLDWPNNPHSNFATVKEWENAHGVNLPAWPITQSAPNDLPYLCSSNWTNPTTTYCSENYLISPVQTYFSGLGYKLFANRQDCLASNTNCSLCCDTGSSLRILPPQSGPIYKALDLIPPPTDASKVEEYESNFPNIYSPSILNRQNTDLPSYIRKQTGGTTPTGDYDPGDTGGLLRWDIISKEPLKKIGCAQEYNLDPTSPNYGCLHLPYMANLPPYDNPIYYHPTNSGCPNVFGLPNVNNIDCCECDIIISTSKWHPGSNHPQLEPEWVKKRRFGCAQFINTDPTSQYYNWHATNYNSLNEGCNDGFGYPHPNNTDCCTWDLIVGIP